MDARRAELALGVGLLIALVVIAFEIGERYPFARFHMFDHRATAASRVIARAPDGSDVELSSLQDFACEGEVELFVGDVRPGTRGCAVEAAYPEAERRVARYLERERTERASGEVYEIVRRTFRFEDPDGPPTVSDCVIGRCAAVER
ncbi:MAG: hypothetical protein AB7S26_37340 [Sandaracinaceae bacterium]